LTDVTQVVLESLSEAERRASAVYLDPQPLEPGNEISIRGGGMTVAVPSVLAFVDLQPAANWAHPCRYVLVGLNDGSITSRDAKFPPDAESLRLVHRGPGVEDWMLLTTSPIGSGED
jgi:hypothetical protein